MLSGCSGHGQRGGTCGGAERGQAALLLLGVVAALLVGLAVLVGFGQALGAKARHQRAADLAAMSAAAAMRDAYPRLFEPPGSRRAAKPAPPDRAAYSRAHARRPRAGRAQRRGAERADVSFPGGSFAPTRVTVRGAGRPASVRVGGAAARGAGAARATAELGAAVGATLGEARPRRAAAATTARWRTGWASRCVPTWRRRSTAWPRRRAATACPVDHQRVPLGRRAGAAVRRQPEPEVGRAARARACTATPPSSTSARRRAYGWLAANAGRVRLHPPLRLGAVALRLRGQPARPRAPGAVRARLLGAARRRARADPARPAVVRAAALPRSDRPGGAAVERADGAAGGPALRGVRVQPVRGSGAGARGDRPVHAGHGARVRAREPFDAAAAIDAQAHLMSDLLRQFGGRVALALAGLQRGAGRGRALRRRPALRGDARLRGQDPRPAGRRRGHTGRRVRGEARGVTLFQLAREGRPGVP